jgi:hypothetical protein
MADIDINPNFSSSPFENSYFHHQSEFSPEKLLYDSLLAESIAKFGVPSVFYITQYTNSDYNDIFGEDINQQVLRSFNIMMNLELPLEEEIFEKYGIAGLDVPTAYCSIKAFTLASSYISSGSEYVSAFAPYVPKAGDFVKTVYSPVMYRIVSVKTKSDQFLQTPHSYKFILKVAQDEHLTVDPSLSGDDIAKLMDIEDIFNISGAIDREKGTVLYDDSQETPPDNPFNNW